MVLSPRPAIGKLRRLTRGPVERVLEVLGKAALRHPSPQGDKLPLARYLADDPGVVLGVRRRGDAAGEVHQVGVAPAGIQQLSLSQDRADADQVRRIASPLGPQDGLVNLGVGLAVEVLGSQDLRDTLGGLGGDQAGAQDALLRLEVLRGDAIDQAKLGRQITLTLLHDYLQSAAVPSAR
ncbi:hypothetical protein D3C86_773730 [compost metagenome]